MNSSAAKNSEPQISAWMMSIFARYNRRFLRRHFHSIRILKDRAPGNPAIPTVIYLNHASWWDPLVSLFLARRFFAGRPAFAPIDSAMLQRYRFLRRLGFFGIEPGTVRDALIFIRTARALLTQSRNMLWVTPQGRFADTRERPVQLERGIGAVASHCDETAFVPLAIEYTFWAESRPEILVAFGEPIVPSESGKRSPDAWTELFARRLEATQDDLAVRSQRREPADWLLLSHGKAGTNMFYDAWQRLRALARRTGFSPAHVPDWSK